MGHFHDGRWTVDGYYRQNSTGIRVSILFMGIIVTSQNVCIRLNGASLL